MTHENPTPFRFYHADSDESSAQNEDDENYSREIGYKNWLITLDTQQVIGVIDAQKKREIIARALLTRDKRIAELQAENEKDKEIARIDTLTRLPNRRAFDERFAGLVAAGEEFGMLILDIDHFKEVNDKFGHLQGDSVLAEVALRISTNIRQVEVSEHNSGEERRESHKVDFPARIGGEEMAILLPGVNDVDTLFTRAEKVRTAIEETPFRITYPDTSTRNITITTSIGGSVHNGTATGEQTFQQADSELYQSKRNGRNRTNIFGRKRMP